jgi:carbohydrate kinase (thermoresistant glucokinase family)
VTYPTRVVVMGVAGSGKSTIARAVAARLSAAFVEGDDLHPPGNVAKMAAGLALDDEDRWPWLAAVREALRQPGPVVAACSALKRSYRDLLRAADGIRFVYLRVDPGEATQRTAARLGHFMSSAMVQSQYQALEPPADDETDVAGVDAGPDVATVVARALEALAALRPGTAVRPLLVVGGPGADITRDDLPGHVQRIIDTVVPADARRVLLVPPDHTRVAGRAGLITRLLFEALAAAGRDPWVLPALGTHQPMSEGARRALFEGQLPAERILTHHWRMGLVGVGEIGAAEVAAISAGRMERPIAIEIDGALLMDWDLVVSVGQVVPHEVIGMANYTKNVVIGLGGAATINTTHLLGALCDMEAIMGRVHTPVRDVVDAAFDRYLAPRTDTLWVLTVVQDTHAGVVQRGLFVGRGGSGASGGAAYRDAAEVAAACNITVTAPMARVVCWLDEDEFHSTWLANKAVYRTRMALADGAELVLLAPGVSRFGEDAIVDRVIRRHGYRGTPAVLEALAHDPELADNLGAAAHLIHGSSEGRFRIVYCTDPGRGGLGRPDIEAAGYAWRPLAEELELLAVAADTPTGDRRDANGDAFYFIARPALGLWSAGSHFQPVDRDGVS